MSSLIKKYIILAPMMVFTINYSLAQDDSSKQQYAYVTNSIYNTINTYTINDNGNLTQSINPVVNTQANPGNIIFSPSRNNAYVVNQASNSISMYSIGNSGEIAPLNIPTISTDKANPLSLKVSPNGKYAYVTYESAGFISIYNIDTSGILKLNRTIVSPYPYSLETNGNYVYVTSTYSNLIYMYQATESGSLSLLNSPKVATGSVSYSMAVSPNGKYAYAANFFDGSISMYSISSSGVLVPLKNPKIASGKNPYTLSISPSGNYLYAGNWGDSTITMYSINSSTGQLTPLSPAVIASGANPSAIQIDLDGNYAYVMHQYNSYILVFSISPNGNLTQINSMSIQGKANTVGINRKFISVAYSCPAPSSVQLGSVLTGFAVSDGYGTDVCAPGTAPSGFSPCYYGNYNLSLLINGVPSVSLYSSDSYSYYSLSGSDYMNNQKVVKNEDYDLSYDENQLSCIYAVTGNNIIKNPDDPTIKFKFDVPTSNSKCVISGTQSYYLTPSCTGKDCKVVCTTTN